MKLRHLPLLLLVTLACAIPASAQGPTGTQPTGSTRASNGKVGIAVSASTLGVSFDGAVKIHPEANLRAGLNLLNYSQDFDEDGTTYAGAVTLKSVHAYLDWFPFGGGFHISPGMVLHNSNKATLTATIPPGDEVDIDDTTYQSSAGNPIRVSGQVVFKSARPAILIGWGNMIPRSRRVSVPFQLGVVFQGLPAATLAFTGIACAPNGSNCRDIATDTTIQTKVKAEEAQLNQDIKIFRFYPVLSIGIGIRF
jgi:hypothetical protein